MTPEHEPHLTKEQFREYKEAIYREMDSRFESERAARQDADKAIWKEIENRKSMLVAMWLLIAGAVVTILREWFTKGIRP